MKISDTKKTRISEQILAFLYSLSPKPEFTSKISAEVARDEEFIKKILQELKEKSLVTEIKKNPKEKTISEDQDGDSQTQHIMLIRLLEALRIVYNKKHILKQAKLFI